MLLFVFLISCLFLMPLKLEKNPIHQQPSFSFRCCCCCCTIVYLSFSCLLAVSAQFSPNFLPAGTPVAFFFHSGVVSSLNRDLFVVAASLSRSAKKRSRCGRSGVIKYRLNLDFSSVQFLFCFCFSFSSRMRGLFIVAAIYQETPKNEVVAFTGE